MDETDGPMDETDGQVAMKKDVIQKVNANAAKVNMMRQNPVLSQEHFIPGKILHIEKDKERYLDLEMDASAIIIL